MWCADPGWKGHWPPRSLGFELGTRGPSDEADWIQALFVEGEEFAKWSTLHNPDYTFESRIRVRRSNDQGATFGPPSVVATYDGNFWNGAPGMLRAFGPMAISLAVDRSRGPHRGRLYVAWDEATWAAYRRIFTNLVSTVDGVERQAVPWPTWTLTTEIDTSAYGAVVRDAIRCHQSQMPSVHALPAGEIEALLARQTFYRVFSLVNGGRERETDLFAGIPRAG